MPSPRPSAPAVSHRSTTGSREMENEDIVIEKDGEIWLRYAFWKPGEIEPRTQREYTHNIKFDIDPPYDEGAPSMVVIPVVLGWFDQGRLSAQVRQRRVRGAGLAEIGKGLYRARPSGPRPTSLVFKPGWGSP